MKLTRTQNTEVGFARYDIYQSTTAGILGTKLITIADRSTTSCTATNLLEDTTYYFTVGVVDAVDLFSDSVQVNV